MKIRLEDCIETTIDNRGRNPKAYFSQEKYPVIDNFLIKNSLHPDMSAVTRFIDEETFNNFLRGYIHKDMPIMTLVGNGIGNVTLAPSDECAIIQNTIGFLVNEKIDQIYLYYYFLSEQERIRKFDRGSGQPSIRKTDILAMEIDIPDIKTQKKIAAILRGVDEKIESNNCINDNLQQQAQAVFSAWLATHAPIADEVTLGSICLKVTDGSHFSPKDEPSAKIPMLSVKDMEEFDFNLTSCKHISAVDYQKMVANDCVPQVDDILVAKDGSYLKEIFICNEQRELAILSSIAIFRPDTSIIYPEILLAFLKSPRVLQEVRDNYVSGSALPRIVLKDFKKLQFLLPNLTAQEEIAPLLAAIRSQIAVNVAENQRLSQLRDALLPKLMSGEIDVSNIQL
ncbi:MAG: restriction endonuclease subunit S [Clostridia bacterium]|nr:restriction endonuclease subunit S [Clostridia bacterium]